MAPDILDAQRFSGQVQGITDSQYSKGVLVQGWNAKATKQLTALLHDRLLRGDVILHWIADRVDMPENARADARPKWGWRRACG